MAVTFRNASQVIGTGTSPTATEPTGAVNGDYLVAFAEVDNADITLPAGWSPLFGGQKTQGTTRFFASYIARGASAPDLTWIFTGTQFRQVDVDCIKTSGGTITLDSQSAAGGSGTDTGTTTQPNPPGTVAAAASSLAICMGNNAVGAAIGAVVAPTGYVVRSLNSVAVDTGMADKSLSASGNEDPAAFAGWGTGSTADWWHGGTVTFTDVAAADVVLRDPLTKMAFRESQGLQAFGGNFFG